MAPLARFACTLASLWSPASACCEPWSGCPCAGLAHCAHEDAETTSDSTRIPTPANSGRRSFTYVSYHGSGGIVAVFVYNVSLRKYSAPPLVLEMPVQQPPAAPSQTRNFLLHALYHTNQPKSLNTWNDHDCEIPYPGCVLHHATADLPTTSTI